MDETNANRGILLTVVGVIVVVVGASAFDGWAATVVAIVGALLACTGAFVTFRDRRGQ